MNQKFYKGYIDAVFKAVFCKKENKELLEKLLEEILETDVKIERILVPEAIKKNVYVKGKTLDVIVSANNRNINIELNSYSNNYIRRRNMAYICNRYGNYIKRGEKYTNMPEFVQINITNESKEDIPDYEVYEMRGKREHKTFIDNFIIYEFNLPKIKKLLYNGEKKYEFLALLGLDKNELENYRGDKEMKKLTKEIIDVNEDKEFIEFMSDEDDTKIVQDTMNDVYYRDGIKDGIQEGTLQIVKKLLSLDVDIETIIKSTGLTKEEIESLK